MHRNSLLFLIVCTMLSSAAKAFSTPTTRTLIQRNVNVFTRFMSSVDGGGDETSIVDICKGKIVDALGTDNVKVTGAYDDPNGSHISIQVISDKFEGKRLVQRQQMVYKALWEELQGPVHAVDAMICKTPDE